MSRAASSFRVVVKTRAACARSWRLCAAMTVTFTDTPVLTHGRFGAYGGQYVPETIMPALAELEAGFLECLVDDGFQTELGRLLRTYVGRPTPLYEASRFAERIASGPVWVKGEDLAHAGAQKI